MVNGITCLAVLVVLVCYCVLVTSTTAILPNSNTTIGTRTTQRGGEFSSWSDPLVVTSSDDGDYLIVYVQPSSNNLVLNNCTSTENPCKSVNDALSYATSIGKYLVHVYLMDGEYSCGMYCYKGLRRVILESLNEQQRIDCKGGSLFGYISANGLKFSNLNLDNFTINDGSNVLNAISLIEIEGSIVMNSLIYEPNAQFGTISVSIVNSHLENVEIDATVRANISDSTLKHVKHTQEVPSLRPYTYIDNCTIEDYQFISSAEQNTFFTTIENGFSLLKSRVKDSNFLIYRTLKSEISKNTFTGSVIISQSFLKSSNFEQNRISNGNFQFSAYYIDVLFILSNECSDMIGVNQPVFKISNTLQTMFQINSFVNVPNCVSVSQSNYISLFQTSFTNSSISLRVDSLMDVVSSSVMLDGCSFTNNGDLTVANGAFIKANIIQVVNTYFGGNKAMKGGGLYVEGIAIGLELQSQNNTALMGGAIYAKLLQGSYPLSLRVTANYNKAQFGGAIFVEHPEPSVDLGYLRCYYNQAVFAGGCIYISEPGPYVKTGFLLQDSNQAGSYGDFIGEPLNNITFVADLTFSNTSVSENITQNQVLIYSQYPGQELTINIQNLQTYLNNRRVSVKKLGDQVDIAIPLSEGIIYSKKFISNQLDSVSYTIAISEKELKQVHGYITIQNIVQNITINILACPKGKTLENPLSTGFVCLDTIVDNSYMIIVPISVILGILLMIFIILLLILTFRGAFIVYMKLNRLKRKEIAEKNLEEKVIENSFYYESQMPLLLYSDNSTSSQSLIIPIEEISIEKKIGEGSSGVVYLGKWKDKKVAIKSLKADDMGDELGDFEREAAILNSLSHPNVVKFYGISITSSQKYMVVEYVSNGSLDRMIYNSRLGVSTIPLKRKLDILISVANGMKYLHTLDPPIIHRDLKPGNILISDNFIGKVSDFGLSTPNYNASTKNIGTVFYIANEMIESGSYTTKVDVYSFSIIMWEVFFEEHCYYNSRCYKIHRFGSNDSSNSNEYNVLLNVLKGSRPKIPFSTDEEMNIWLSEFMLQTEKELSLEKLVTFTRKFVDMMKICWNKDPHIRLSFTEIVSELKTLQSILK